MSDTQFDRIITLFSTSGIEFILIGGIAAMAHGSARATTDVDFVYSRRRENIERIVACLEPHQPYLRGAPPGLPFKFDVKTVEMGLNFTLTSTLGNIDLLGEVVGGGSYDALLPYTDELEVFGARARCVTLERLIQLKRAAGRPRDFEAIAELTALLEERDQKRPQSTL